MDNFVKISSHYSWMFLESKASVFASTKLGSCATYIYNLQLNMLCAVYFTLQMNRFSASKVRTFRTCGRDNQVGYYRCLEPKYLGHTL